MSKFIPNSENSFDMPAVLVDEYLGQMKSSAAKCITYMLRHSFKRESGIELFYAETLAQAARVTRRTIQASLQNLCEIGLVVHHKSDARQIEYFITSMQNLSGMGAGHEVCAWCQVNTFSTQLHHHPVPQRLGGVDVVAICAKCHHEFHVLEKAGLYSLNQNHPAFERAES